MSSSDGPALHEFWGDPDRPLPQVGRKFKVGGLKISGGWSGVSVSIGGRKGVGARVGLGGVSGHVGGVGGTIGGFGSRFGGSRMEGMPGIEPVWDPFPGQDDQPIGIGGRPRGKFDIAPPEPPDDDDDEGDDDDDHDGADDDHEPPEPEWEPPHGAGGGGAPGGGGAG